MMYDKGEPVYARWSLSQPDIGTIEKEGYTAKFMSDKKSKYGATEIRAEAEVEQGGRKVKVKTKTHLRLVLGRGMIDGGPYFTDNFNNIPTLPWSDSQGRRGAKLILDAVAQLPPRFREAIAEVALVRTNWLQPPTGGCIYHCRGGWCFSEIVSSNSLPCQKRLIRQPMVSLSGHSYTSLPM
jgi:hypothetical protein